MLDHTWLRSRPSRCKSSRSPGASQASAPARRRLYRLAGLGLATLLGGCASYRPLALPTGPDLAPGLQALDTILPARTPGGPARQIAIGGALDIDRIGLLAILNDPDLRDERGRMDLARAARVQAGLLPNPSIGLGTEALLGGPGVSSSYSASVSEDLAAIITYHARVRASARHVQAVSANLLWREWQVAQKARLLALDIYWQDQSIQLDRRQRQLLSGEIGQVRQAIAGGSLDLAALAPLQTAEAAIAQDLDGQHLQRLKNWQALDALLGLQPRVRFPIAVPKLAPLPGHIGRLIAGLPRRRPDLVALRLGYRASEASVRSAILGQFPALVLGGSWSSDTSRVRSAGPNVTFDLPIFNRNQGQIAQARATRRLLRAQYQARLDQAVASVRGLQARLRRLSSDLALAHQAAASARSQSHAARQAYSQGNLDLRALSDYETTSLQRQLQLIGLERDIGEARITLALELASGLPKTRITPLDRTHTR